MHVFILNRLHLQGLDRNRSREDTLKFLLYLKETEYLLILSFRRVLYVVCFLLGISPASEL